MKKKQIFLTILLLALCICSLNTVKAASVFDRKDTTGVYKASDDDSTFDIPFFRVSGERTELDKEISQLGMIISNSTVDVSAILKSSQFILANDTVRVNSQMEDALILCSNNVIINAPIDNVIILAGKGITIGEEGNIKENLIILGSDITINGNVDGNVLGITQNMVLNGTIGGKLSVDVVNAQFGENAKVEKGISITTPNSALEVPENVGEATIDLLQQETKSTGMKIKDYLFNILVVVIRDLVTFFLIILIFKRERIEKIFAKVESKGLIKRGILFYIVSLLAIIFGLTLALFILPQVGISALLLGIVSLVVFTLLKNIIVGTFIANLSTDRFDKIESKPNKTLMAIFTFLIIEILETIPFVGEIFKFIVFIFALGIVASLVIKNKKEDAEEDK